MTADAELRRLLADRAAEVAAELSRESAALPAFSAAHRRIERARHAAEVVADAARRPSEPEPL